jgi:hypothetical protein
MTTILRLFVLCVFLLPISINAQINTDYSSTEFEIYLLKDPLVTTAQAIKVPLNNLQLASKPFLSARDIKVYHWSTHQFDLYRRGDSVFQRMSVERYTSAGVPFVVVVGKQRIYLGAFWWPFLSSVPPVTFITLSTPHPSLSPCPICRQPDLRSDPRIHDALYDAGVLVE